MQFGKHDMNPTQSIDIEKQLLPLSNQSELKQTITYKNDTL